MDETYSAFDDSLDDCFTNEDELCSMSSEKSQQIISARKISGIMEEDGNPRTCLVSLMDERKIA
tara:strand:- start:898 stop:1089 length:192 start_codon:yes stop_codon:yes gene_type:complete